MWYYTYTDELYHHGVKGQKWGVRRYQNKDGTLTPEGKERLDDGADRRKSLAKKIAIGAGVTVAALAAIGAVYYVKKNNISEHVKMYDFGTEIDLESLSSDDKILSKGTKLHRISSKSLEDYTDEGKRIFVSYLNEDNRIYKEKMPGYIRQWAQHGIISDDGKKAYEHVMNANNDIKIPSKRTMAELYMKATGETKVDSGKYMRFMSELNGDSPSVKSFFKSVRDLGYNAVVDENDAGNFTKSPLILLNPKEDVINSKSHKITGVERVMNVLLM